MERSTAAYSSSSMPQFLTNIMEKIKTSQDSLLHYGITLGVGFLVGFLLKKFSSYVAVVIAGCLLIIILSHFGIMNVAIDWQKIQSFVGLEVGQLSDQNVFEMLWEWIRLNVTMTLCALVGFFIGLKLG